jgi:hypothetical protein
MARNADTPRTPPTPAVVRPAGHRPSDAALEALADLLLRAAAGQCATPDEPAPVTRPTPPPPRRRRGSRAEPLMERRT